MRESKSQRKLAKNEVIFREHNSKVLASLKNVKDKKKLDEPFLYFYCECSSAHCMERLAVEPNEYDRVHNSRKLFIVKPGHNTPDIEKVVDKKTSFYVVEKYNQPPARLC